MASKRRVANVASKKRSAVRKQPLAGANREPSEKRPVPRQRWLRMLNSGPTVLVSSEYRGRRAVIAVAWSTPASIDPPLLVVSIGVTRASHAIMKAAREFVVNVPSVAQLPLVEIAGTLSARDVDKFTGYGLTAEPAVNLKVPRVAECPGHIECRVVRSHACGDHTLFVGEVVGAYATAAFFDERLKVEAGARTLHHLGGDLFHLPGEIVRMPGSRT